MGKISVNSKATVYNLRELIEFVFPISFLIVSYFLFLKSCSFDCSDRFTADMTKERLSILADLLFTNIFNTVFNLTISNRPSTDLFFENTF